MIELLLIVGFVWWVVLPFLQIPDLARIANQMFGENGDDTAHESGEQALREISLN